MLISLRRAAKNRSVVIFKIILTCCFWATTGIAISQTQMLLNSRTPTVSSRAPQQSLAAALKVAYVPLVASTNSVVGPALASSTASTASRCQTSRIAVPIPIVVCCSSSQPATTEGELVASVNLRPILGTVAVTASCCYANVRVAFD